MESLREMSLTRAPVGERKDTECNRVPRVTCQILCWGLRSLAYLAVLKLRGVERIAILNTPASSYGWEAQNT